jgi:hypothetical protein
MTGPRGATFYIIGFCLNSGKRITSKKIDAKREEGIWSNFSAQVGDIKGVHDVYFVFKGKKDLFYFDWWQFYPEMTS